MPSDTSVTDSEDLFNKSDIPDDVTSVLTSPGLGVFKTAFFIFILFILVCSDVFVDKILSTSDNRFTEGRCPTSQGAALQGVIVALSYIILHTLITVGYL